MVYGGCFVYWGLRLSRANESMRTFTMSVSSTLTSAVTTDMLRDSDRSEDDPQA